LTNALCNEPACPDSEQRGIAESPDRQSAWQQIFTLLDFLSIIIATFERMNFQIGMAGGTPREPVLDFGSLIWGNLQDRCAKMQDKKGILKIISP